MSHLGIAARLRAVRPADMALAEDFLSELGKMVLNLRAVLGRPIRRILPRKAARSR